MILDVELIDILGTRAHSEILTLQDESKIICKPKKNHKIAAISTELVRDGHIRIVIEQELES